MRMQNKINKSIKNFSSSHCYQNVLRPPDFSIIPPLDLQAIKTVSQFGIQIQ